MKKNMPENKTYFFCSVAELKQARRITKWIEELRDEISAFYFEEKIWVRSTICPHFGGEFEFNAHQGILRCKWHGWKFDVTTGKSLTKLEAYQSESLIRKILECGNCEPLGCFPYKGQLVQYNFKINQDMLEVIVP